MSQFKVGDLIKIRPEQAQTETHRISTYEVIKVNSVNLKAKNTVTGGLLTIHPDYAILASEAGGAVVTAFDPQEIPLPLDRGALVSFKRAPKGHTTDDLFVVTGESAKGYQLFPLGGSTRYFRGVQAASIVQRKVVSITTEVVA